MHCRRRSTSMFRTARFPACQASNLHRRPHLRFLRAAAVGLHCREATGTDYRRDAHSAFTSQLRMRLCQRARSPGFDAWPALGADRLVRRSSVVVGRRSLVRLQPKAATSCRADALVAAPIALPRTPAAALGALPPYVCLASCLGNGGSCRSWRGCVRPHTASSALAEV
jgi:hypothetical protein